MDHDVRELAALLSAGKAYIQTHDFPDPDAIASAYGLQQLLSRKYGVHAGLCYEGRVDRLCASHLSDALGITLRPYEAVKPDMGARDPICYVDVQRHGANVTDLIGDEVACVDHHPVRDRCDYAWSDLRICGACSSIIAEYWQASGEAPDQAVATALLYGIKSDTANFTRGVDMLDIRMFAYLHPLADGELLMALEHSSIEFTDLRAYGAAIENIELYGRNGFAHIPFACPDGLVAAVSDFILSLVEVDVAVVTSDRPDGVRISARSADADVHAGDLLGTALKGVGSGGGHAAMGGGFAPGLNHELVRNLILAGLDV